MPSTLSSSQKKKREEIPTVVVTSIHAVLLTVKLEKSGSIREATVLHGPEELRKAAIKAAKARNYKHIVTNGWHNDDVIELQVSFPQGRNGPPEIAQVVIGGVPGCVYPTSVRVSPAIMQLHLLNRTDAIYPPRIPDGVILVLRLRIDKKGNVLMADRLSGPDEFGPVAIEAVKKWKYEPYLLNGSPIEVETTVSLPEVPLSDKPLTNPACIPNLPCPMF